MPEIPLEDADGDLQGRRLSEGADFCIPLVRKVTGRGIPPRPSRKRVFSMPRSVLNPLKHGRNASRTSRDPSKIPYLTAQFPFCVSINVQAEFGKPAP